MILSIFSSACVFFPICVSYFLSVFKSVHFYLVGLFVFLLLSFESSWCILHTGL